MPGIETLNKRYFTHHWGDGYACKCLRPQCENVLQLNELCEGDIWMCNVCGLKHEFYTEYVSGPGGRLKYAVVRLLEGEHVRTKGEPGILEFVEEKK